jgi:uncharacterized membrane protein YqjE
MIQRLRAVFATLAEGISSRFDLASVELEDLLARLGVILALILMVGLTAGSAILFLALAIVFVIPPGVRWIVALVFFLTFSGGAAWAWTQLRAAIRAMPAPFATTRDVLRRDAAALRHSAQPPDSETPSAP